MCGYGEIEELQLSTQPPRGLWSTVSACRIRGHHKNTSQCSGWLICDVSILRQCYLSLSRPLQDFPKVGPWAPQYSSSMDLEPKSLHFKTLLGYWYGYNLSFIYSCMDAIPRWLWTKVIWESNQHLLLVLHRRQGCLRWQSWGGGPQKQSWIDDA